MLYQLYEMKNAVSSPVLKAAEAMQEFYRHPFLPTSYTQFGRSMAAGAEVLERIVKRYEKPEWNLPTTLIDGVEVKVTPENALSHRFCDLVHFKRDAKRDDPKVLVVAPMSGHHATLLRGTVEALLPEHDVYITDWINAHNVPLSGGKFGLEEYIDYIINFAEMLGPDVHIIAVCQPSPLVLAAVALMAEDGRKRTPKSLTLMGGPIDTRIKPTQVNDLAAMKPLSWFESNVIAKVPMFYPGFMRKVYPGFMQLSGFMSMNLDRHVGAHVRLFNHLIEGDGDNAGKHREFYDEYLSVCDLPAEYYLETLKVVFMEHHLPNGTMKWRDRTVNPAAITNTGLLTVEGELDDITGVGQTKAAHDLCPNIPKAKRLHHEQKKVGHYGIFNGRRWRDEILPIVHKHIRANA